MRFLSVCSGIEAASLAWEPLGWRCVGLSEIEAFPRAVLEQRQGAVACDWDHRAPESGLPNFTPMFGDFTRIEDHHVGPIDLLVGGTPCQDYSIAGQRAGLDGDRGNLTLEFSKLADRTRPKWLVWENVPGAFSTNEGRDFGAILATFSGRHGSVFERPATGWGTAGVVEQANADSYGLAWRVLDAQYFGVPQRRRRVFIVGYIGDWRRAAAVLFERESLQRHPAPLRKQGQGVAGTLDAGLGVRGQPEGERSHLIPHVANPLTARMHKGVNTTMDEGQTMIAHTLKAEGFDASEDGTGRGTPIVPTQQAYSIMPMNSGKDYKARPTDVSQPLMAGGPVGGNQGGDFVAAIQERAVSENPDAGPDGAGFRDDGQAYTLEARATTQAIAFSAKDYGADAMSELSPTLRAGGHANSHANAGVMPAVAFDMRGREGGAQFEGPHDSANIRASSGGSSRSYIAASAVRRLTPRECERLQGFPDDYSQIEWRNKAPADCPDGRRYKALGNSMAVPVMRWIGERIDMCEGIVADG
ncbi:MAG: DNA cytosine methyltransferase [Pseudomonadota bacterium]